MKKSFGLFPTRAMPMLGWILQLVITVSIMTPPPSFQHRGCER
jgi:hypothetical protein